MDVVVGTETPLNEAHMVGGDVRGDSDHLARLVSPHNDTIGKLATGSLVFLDCCIPRVATDPTFTYITLHLDTVSILESNALYLPDSPTDTTCLHNSSGSS